MAENDILSMDDAIASGMSFSDYFTQGGMENPGSLGNRFLNFFIGNIDAEQDKWNTAYNKWAQENQYKLDYEYQRALRQTEYADAVEAMRNAGLNPYAILNGGSFSTGGNYSSNASQLRAENLSKKGSNSRAGLAALIYILARVVAKCIVG